MLCSLQFENHLVGQWQTTMMSEVVKELDDYGYDCFWQVRAR